MKKLSFLGVLLIFIGVLYFYKDSAMEIWDFISYKININTVSIQRNNYYRNYDFIYVQNTNTFSPNNKQDILNIYYTVINSGMDSFSFYCPSSYASCLNDVANIANDQIHLSHINNFVHPYNSFQHIETTYNNLGRVTITTNKSYTSEEIQLINAKINYIEENILNKSLSIRDNILLAHDYIINNSAYDSLRGDKNITNYRSDIAYGPLIEGYGICGGYTDALELILERLGVISFKISSDEHVWNALLVDNHWLNIDLTWDDPVTNNGKDILSHDFFLISTQSLLRLENVQHHFDQNIYKELKEA